MTSKREIVYNFLDNLPEEEQKEWVSVLREHYPEPDNTPYLKKYYDTHKDVILAAKKMRRAVLRHPCIAFDLFEGIYSYDKRSPWTYHVGKTAHCKACKLPIGNKPVHCKSEGHKRYYSKKLEYARMRMRENKYRGGDLQRQA